jgi:hypothetical protein
VKRKKRSMKEMVADSTPRLQNREVEEIGNRVWQRLKTEMGKRDLSLRSLTGDGWTAPSLQPYESRILKAAAALAGQGTAESIFRSVEKCGDLALVSQILDDMKAKGLLVSLGTGDASQRQFQITELGERALIRARSEGVKDHLAEAMEAAEGAEERVKREHPERLR